LEISAIAVVIPKTKPIVSAQ